MKTIHGKKLKNNKNTKHYLGLMFVIILFFLIIQITSVQAEEPEFLNVELQQSIDQITWEPIMGCQQTGYNLPLNESIPYYYLDVRNAPTNTELQQGFYGFTVTSAPFGFLDYWDDKGVNEEALAGTWQSHMWTIVNGSSPIFYIHVGPNQQLSLIDGLLRDFGGDDTALLRVNGDYFPGDYTYEGNITSIDSDVSHLIWNINFLESFSPANRPYVPNIEMMISTDQSNWNDLFGTHHSFYLANLTSSESFYWIDVDVSNVSDDIASDFFGFYLKNYPSGYLSYWASKGVTASSPAGSWQAHMWKIINGDAPRFYVTSNGGTSLNLIDGLYRDHQDYGFIMPYRVNGDITRGFYQFEGTIADEDGIDCNLLTLDFSFQDDSNYRVWVDNNYDVTTPGWGITHFDTIEDGVANTIDYGLVSVQPGTYRELIEINKPVIVKSVWGALSTTISDDSVSYSQFVDNNGHTVKINSSYVLIDDFTIERYEYILEDAAVGTKGSIYMSNVELHNCEIETFFDGVYFSNINELSLSFNEYDCRIDDYVGRLVNINDFSCYYDNFVSYSDHGYNLYNCSNGYIGQLSMSYKRNSGLVMDDSSAVLIDWCSFLDGQMHGVFIQNSYDIKITNSYFRDNVYGIALGENAVVDIVGNGYDFNNRNINRAVYIQGETIHYSQLQQAIDVATFGANIYLYEGNYTENIVIDKRISIHGRDDADETIIIGTNSSPTILIGNTTDIPDMLIEDISIHGGYHSLKTGIYQSVSGLTIENCIIKDPIEGYAVYIDPHNYSDLSSSRDGTNIFTKPVSILSSEIIGGLYYHFWPFEVYSANINTQLMIEDNDIDEIFLNGSISVKIMNNNINSLGMMYSRDVLIDTNTFENPWETRYGIYLWSVNGTPSVSDVEITHNSINEYRSVTVPSGVSGIGILVAGAKDIDIKNNAIRANADGVWLTQDYINRFGQRCVGEVYDINIEDNDFELCQSGITITERVNGSIIDGNFFDRNQQGIRVHRAGYHLIANNTLTENYEGIQLDEGCTNNLIYNNYFDNIYNARDLSTTANTWNVTLRPDINILGGPYIGGNYWSDYPGSDADGDSIGDNYIPYNGSGNILTGGDYLPVILTDVTPPSVRVIYPNGGESVNGTIEIRWSASDDFDDDIQIDLEYSNDSGLTWRMISPNEDDDGRYDWDLNSLSMGTEYLVRVTATDNAGYSSNDTSDSTFTIYREFPSPSIEIVHPQQGFWYFMDTPSMRFLPENVFVIGPITFEIAVTSPLDVEMVEFYVDDQLISTVNTAVDDIFSWTWDERVLFYHEVRILAYDINGVAGEAEIGVTIFNFNLI